MGRWFVQKRAARLAGGLLLALGVLAAAGGCSNKKKDPGFTEVSGRVLYKGQPVPGGEVTFVTPEGFVGNATIDEQGNYKMESAPLGPVKIGVDNQMLQGAGGGRRGAPAKMPGLKRPDAEPPRKMPGHYVRIPDKYVNPQDSGLTYTVTSGSQTHDITLD